MATVDELLADVRKRSQRLIRGGKEEAGDLFKKAVKERNIARERFIRGFKEAKDPVSRSVGEVFGELQQPRKPEEVAVDVALDQFTGGAGRIRRATGKVAKKKSKVFLGAIGELLGRADVENKISKRHGTDIARNVISNVRQSDIKKSFGMPRRKASKFLLDKAGKKITSKPSELFGAMAGIGRDEEGNLQFDSKVAAAGIGGLALGKKISRTGILKTESTLDTARQTITAANKKTPVVQNLAANPGELKDISAIRKGFGDVFRNFEQVFGKGTERLKAVKRQLLDPLDNAKAANISFQKNLLEEMDTNIVKKLGISKGSKLSGSVQQFGEGRIKREELVRKFGEKKANKIVEASTWFRGKYDDLIDQVNETRSQIYPNDPERLVPKRQDYFRHFRELTGIEGLKNVFDTPAGIDPNLVGISAFTKPHAKFLGFAQRRLGGKFKDDAVGGFLDYVPSAGYAINIDPQIRGFRQLRKSLAESTSVEGTAEFGKLNNFTEFLDLFANDLSGKTNPMDRALQTFVPGGRKTFQVMDFFNRRAKANLILGNVSSSVSQIFNVPQGLADAGPSNVFPAAMRGITSVFNKNDPIHNSKFVAERYGQKMFTAFDKKLLDQPKKFAAWMVTVLDEVGTKFVWQAEYSKAIKKKIDDPIRFADEQTRKMVAGRGIGEVPLIQKSRMFQMVLPFQLEVANQWSVMKDFVDEKRFGAVVQLFIYNNLFNSAAEGVTGRRITFDPIDALMESFSDDDLDPAQRALRLPGEILSNLPGGGLATQLAVPRAETRDKFFGDADPTRFGTGLLLSTKGDTPAAILKDIGARTVLPFGGKQLQKGLRGVKAAAEGVSKSKSGRIRFPVNEIVKPVLFGEFSTKTARLYFDLGLQPLGDKQTEKFQKLVKEDGFNPNKLFYVFQKDRMERSLKTLGKKLDKDESLTNQERDRQFQKQQRISNRKLNEISKSLKINDANRAELNRLKFTDLD